MMGDDLVLMQDGRILQAGSPRDCYLKPASIDAARLLGEANVLPGELRNGRIRTAFGEVMAVGRNGPSYLMVRPEGVVVGDAGEPALVANAAFMGAAVMLLLEAPGGETALARVASATAPAPGSQVRVTLDPRFCKVFAA